MPIPTLHPGLYAISLLFRYPDGQWALTPPPDGIDEEIGLLLDEIRGLDSILRENEYVRLFINAMPEAPCAPYGSVYLEGSVMGASTLKVADIYRKYGMVPEEMADHIAVESEFLAWLHGAAADESAAMTNFNFLLGHLRQWSEAFLQKVEQHDRLGCYRKGAELARRILAQIE
jgi:TorA maturation chaperone TorD